MLTKPMKTLIRKELREHYAPAAWIAGVGVVTIIVAAISAATAILFSDEPTLPIAPAYVIEFLRHPSGSAAMVAVAVGVIACSGAFTSDAGPVTGIFAVTRPVSRCSIMVAKFVATGVLIGCAYAITLAAGSITHNVLPTPDGVGSQAGTFLTAGDSLKVLWSATGVFLAAVALSMIPTNRLLAVLLCGYLAAFAQWPSVVLGVLTGGSIGVGRPETVADVIAGALAPAFGFLAAIYFGYAQVPLLERSTRLERALLALLTVPLATLLMTHLIAALVIAVRPMLE